jgi:poly(hydroxyalkanoate) depolymerase family esterase
MVRRTGRSRRIPSGLFGLLPSLPKKRRRRPAAPIALPALLRPAATPPVRKASGAGRRRSPGRWLHSSHVGSAGSRSYDVYLPAGHRRTTRMPLVVLLHGCNQTSKQFVAATRFTALADRHGFIIAAPRQTRGNHPGGCWRWYESAHQARGAGEPAILAGITAEVLAEPSRWRIDRSRVYVAGISAGGAMALILGATYPDVFAAVGMHSAPAYQSASSGGSAFGAMNGRRPPAPPVPGAQMAPLIVFQGTADSVVHERGGSLLVEQWLAYDTARSTGARDPRRITRSRDSEKRSADGRRYSVRSWYSARGRKQLEYWRIDGLGHAWSGGVADGSYSDPRGPRASTAMWQFFASHTCDGPSGPVP